MAIVPKKTEPKEDGATRSFWAPTPLWKEIQAAAEREGYSTSKLVVFLLRAGLNAYYLERAAEKSGPK